MTKTHLRFAIGAAVLAGAGFLVRQRAARAEREHPPLGRFITVDGVRLHYIDEGAGPPLVLLHGLGSMVEDFVLSGLVREASKRYRVIAFDRPGYGHSARPRRWRFGPVRQAHLFNKALHALDAHRPIVFGHSWGTLVAASLALEHPEALRSLVLASGLYFPSVRVDTPFLIPPALPLLGDLMRHTLSPLFGRAMWAGAAKLIFAPAKVPASFDAFPASMALRPGQLRAVAEEALFTLPATLRLARRYHELNLPLVLVAGDGDRYVSPSAHTRRLHGLVRGSRLLISPGSGHMVHHSDLPLVMSAIDAAAAFPSPSSSPAISMPGKGTAG
jgi:pimeloyl-ACP methyl ester carboxylesterase